MVVPKGPSQDRDPIEPGTVQTQIRDNSYTVCLQSRDTDEKKTETEHASKQIHYKKWRQFSGTPLVAFVFACFCMLRNYRIEEVCKRKGVAKIVTQYSREA